MVSGDNRLIVYVLRLRYPDLARAAMVEHSDHRQKRVLKALISGDTTALTF
ncbi:MAG: hypothetical protein U5N27_09570 [Rhizobium sp.]|nr:hypothetical protein [Rhizobium sp.]